MIAQKNSAQQALPAGAGGTLSRQSVNDFAVPFSGAWRQPVSRVRAMNNHQWRYCPVALALIALWPAVGLGKLL